MFASIKKIKYIVLKTILFGEKKDHYKKKLENLKNTNGCIEYSKYIFKGENNTIKLFRNGKEIENIYIPHINIDVTGSNNCISLNIDRFETNEASINLLIQGDNNCCRLEKDVRGNWNIAEYGDNNLIEVGENTACGEFSISLHSNHFKIGRDCMISDLEELWTDGHSVIDSKTKELLNYPKTPIIIGDHVWLGRRCTLTKGAQIPNDCIVGIGAIVTKAFTEPNCVLAGVPARVVKRGVSWDGRRPVVYKEYFEKEKLKKMEKQKCD